VVNTPHESADSALSPTTWLGWQRFVTEDPPTPPTAGSAPRSMEERLVYHSRFVTVDTPAVAAISKAALTVRMLGRYQDATARPCLIVTGPPTTGKTTALLHMGRASHRAEMKRSPAAEKVPVVYVLVPPGASAKALAEEFARFLGVPLPGRMTLPQITASVVASYARAGVGLVLVDEIHRLNPRTTSGAEAADWLKDLTERIPATFVYAGIDVAESALLQGVRGQQLSGRATLVHTAPLSMTDHGKSPFTQLVTDMENALDLTRHRPGTLQRLARYLHSRTGGRIGSLSRLIRQAALEAITSGDERITKASLETITLDHIAEENYRTRPPGAAAGRKPNKRQ